MDYELAHQLSTLRSGVDQFKVFSIKLSGEFNTRLFLVSFSVHLVLITYNLKCRIILHITLLLNYSTYEVFSRANQLINLIPCIYIGAGVGPFLCGGFLCKVLMA